MVLSPEMWHWGAGGPLEGWMGWGGISVQTAEKKFGIGWGMTMCHRAGRGRMESGMSPVCPGSDVSAPFPPSTPAQTSPVPGFKLVLPCLSFSRPGTTLERARHPPPARDHDPESSPFRPPEPEAMRFVEPLLGRLAAPCGGAGAGPTGGGMWGRGEAVPSSA